MFRLTVACLLGIGFWLCLTDLTAQVASFSPPSTRPSADSEEQVIQRVPLDAMVTLDNGDMTIGLPGNWPLTVLDDLYSFILQKEQKNSVPSFIIRNVSATGTIVGNHVETHVQIVLITSGTQPVQIPLGFKEGILPFDSLSEEPPFQYTGVGSAYLSVDSMEKQYLAVIVPQTKQAEEPPNTENSENSDQSQKPPVTVTSELTQRHTLSFSIWLPFVQNGEGENRLSLSFPPSLRSQFQLKVPMTDIDSSVTQGSILTAQENAEQKSTVLQMQGLHANTEITWKKRKIEVINDRPVFLVENASIDARLDTRMTVYDVVLPISSATGSFETLQIRLPKGSVLDRDMTDRYAAAGGYSVGDANDQFVIPIRFQQKMSIPVTLRLRVFQQFEGNDPDFERELAGFEVLGAERQTGFLTVSGFPAEKKLYWESVRGIHRVEDAASISPVPAASVVVSAGSPRFEFTSQPFLLRVRVLSQQTHINVKPEYQFRISRGSVEMNARLSYTVSGSKVDSLKIFLSDAQWNYECLSSLVDTASVDLSESGELTIPLRNPMDGTFDIELRAFRSLPIDEDQTHRIFLPMPMPQVEWCEPAPVTIISSNDVEIEPIDESYAASSRQRTSGMTRQTRRSIPVRSDLSELQQEPLFYRTELTGAVFVADLTYHRQKINATMQTECRFLENNYQITQNILYDVDYAPVDRLFFLIPDELLSTGNIQIRSGNQVLELRDVTITGSEQISGNWKRKMIQLSEPTFQLPLVFEYSVSPPRDDNAETKLFSLPFICPADILVSEHRFQFFTPSDNNVTLQEESKQYWESFNETRRDSLEDSELFRSVQSPNKIALSINVSEKNTSDVMIVERAWLQTWLTGDIRVDRASYLVKNVGDTITLQLPPNALQEHRLDVHINHQPVQPNIAAQGELTLSILPEQQSRPVEVSVEYRYPFQMTTMEVPIILPTFSKETRIQYEYWQVFLQPNKHIVACSGGWTLEYNWTWNGLFWGRSPSLRKSDIGFDAEDDRVDSKSQYLFSHLQPSAYVTLYIVSRSHIVLCSSSIALFIGLLLIYVRQTRYIGSLFGLGVMLLAVFMYQPPIVFLILQASVFGVFLALGAGYIYRIFQRQKQWIPPTLPVFDDHSQPYTTVTPSQTVHEVIMDDTSPSKDTPVVIVNNHNGAPPNAPS